MTVQKGLIELVGRSDADWVTRYHCNVQGVTMSNRSKKKTAISLSSCEGEFYAQENFWVWQNSSKKFTTSFQFVSTWIQTGHVTFSRGDDREESSTLKYDAWQHNNRSETSVNRSDAWIRKTLHAISGWTTNAVALTETWTTRIGMHERMRGCEHRFQSSMGVSIPSFDN